MEGFSLHANTHLHANDRQGLERLCRYGARGTLALERLSARQETRKERTTRVDQAGLLRKTFAVDVFACVRCGGRRRVLAYVEHLGLPTAGARLASGREPPSCL